MDILRKSFPASTIKDEQYQTSLSYLRNILRQFIRPHISSDIAELNDAFEKAILKLSSVDPIIAYRLRGKNKVISSLDNWIDFATSIIDSEGLSSSEDKQYLEELNRTTLEPTILDETLNDLKDMIYTFADKLDRRTKKELAELIDNSSQEYVVELEEKIKGLFQDIQNTNALA